jgi:hypothetical protein
MSIKITRKLLDNYRKMKKEIPILENELAEMKKGEAGLGNSTVFDYRTGYPRPQSVIGFDWQLYEQRQVALQKKKDQVAAVEMWIEEIEDGQTRCVFRMFYMDGMKWEKIAEKTGHTYSADYPRLMIRDKYLEKKHVK